ncbi:MAG: hypothetical protein ACRBK7_22420 [Acidimicrobiales bacterium]
MEADIQSRLEELRAEKDKGEQMLMNLETEANELRSQLLRISGAIQVLEELSGSSGSELPAE